MTSGGAIMLSTNRIRAVTWGALLIIFFLGLGLRLYQLDGDSLWLDEIVTATKAQLGLLSIPRIAAQTDTFPPLLYMLTHLFMRYSGDSDFVVRLPAALLGSLSILLIYGVGSMLWTRVEGLAGAFLLSVNPWHIRYSQEARWYAPMVFLSLLSLLFLLKALQGNSRGPWVAFALVTSLALYNHYFAFLILPAQVLYAARVIWKNWASTRRGPTEATHEDKALPRSLGQLATGGPSDQPVDVRVHHPRNMPNARTQASYLICSLVLIALCYMPWLPMMHQQLFGPIIHFQGVRAEVEQGIELSLQLYQDMLIAYSGVSGAALLLLLILFLLGLARCKPRQLLLFGLWFAMPFLFISLAQTARWVHPRYGIHVLPIYLLLVARGIDTIRHYLGWYGPGRIAHHVWPLAGMTSLVILVGILQMPSLRDYYFEQKEDWRAAAGYLADHLQPGDAILAESLEFRIARHDNRVPTCLQYYLNAYGMESVPILRVRLGLWHELQQLQGWNGQLWGVIYSPDALAASENAQRADFFQISVIGLREPSGRAMQDTELLLKALLDILPRGDAHFDVHLTLADIGVQTGQLVEAETQLQMASAVQPDDSRASRSLDRLQLRRQQLSQALEGMRHPLWRDIGAVMALLGHDLSQEAKGSNNTLQLTLWWQVLQDTDTDYTSFIHVVGQDNRVWAQADIRLQQGERPTSTWKVGEIVRQQCQVVLPADMPSGEYSIMVGAYYWETGERLPVWDGSGRRLADDVIILVPEGET